MSITQDRMIAVIAAGQAWETAFQMAKTLCTEAILQEQSPEETAQAIFKAFFIATPQPALTRALIEENVHFKSRHGFNVRERQRQRKKRLREGKRVRPELQASLTLQDIDVNLLNRTFDEAPPGAFQAYRDAELREHPNRKEELNATGELKGHTKSYQQVLKSGEVIERTVTRNQNTNDPEGPPPSIDLEDDGDIGL